MDTSVLKILIVLMAAATGFHSGATEFIHQEYAAETSETRLGSTPLRGGTIYVKRCDHCPTVAVSLNAGTLYYQHKNRITAEAAMALDGNGSTIFFDPNTRFVTRIVFWRN